MSCRRNAFIMLFNCAQERAIEYLATCLDEVPTWGDMLQLAVVELIRKLCRSAPTERVCVPIRSISVLISPSHPPHTPPPQPQSKYLRCIFSLLESSSPAVRYESAQALLSLSSAPTAVRAVTSSYVDLMVNESDNNVKMIVLDRLTDVKSNHEKIVGEMMMDLMRVLSSPNMDIRRKTLGICLDLVTPRNVEGMIQYLRKEIGKTQGGKEGDKEAGEYRQLLVQAIHRCAVQFPETSGTVVNMIMDFLGDSNAASAFDVVTFVREVVHMHDGLQHTIVEHLLEVFPLIKASRVIRPALWIVGEFSTTRADIEASVATILEAVGSLPLVKDSAELDAEEAAKKAAEEEEKKKGGATGRVAILADGTYATQTSVEQKSKLASSSSDSSLRSLLFAGDFFLCSVIVNALTKLALRYRSTDAPQDEQNLLESKVMLVGASMLRLGTSDLVSPQIDEDSTEQIMLAIRVLDHGDEETQRVWLAQCRHSLDEMLKAHRQASASAESKTKKTARVQADDLISFRHLRARRGGPEDDVDVDVDLAKATNNTRTGGGTNLSRVVSLTGFSDPIYAEANIQSHDYDLLMDVLVVNQTPDTLQNVTLELATLGDLKLCERPQSYTIGPLDSRRIKVSVKIVSCETGLIFGSVVYDVAGQASSPDKNTVVLNEVHVDIVDYIYGAHCTDQEFRTEYSQDEWENRVAIRTDITDLHEYIKHLMAVTNMNCITSDLALEGDCEFLSANLYAKSIFGEDALANVSIERVVKGDKAMLRGYCRLRSKSQGLALSLGDKITLKQKGPSAL